MKLAPTEKILLALAGFLAVVALWPSFARGDEGMGYHNPQDPDHWYPQECCSLLDCRPLMQREIHRTEKGFRVGEYDQTWQSIRPSGDNRWHACYYQDGEMQGSIIVAPDSRTAGRTSTPCIFAPKNAY